MVRFGVMTDLHTDIIHDAKVRVNEFVREVNENDCDFAIQLGDFIQPEFIGSYSCKEDRVSAVMKNVLAGKGLSPKEKQEIWKEFKLLNCPLYHVLGNHDLDLYSKEEILKYWGVKSSTYSFDSKDFHFIVLDANYGVEDSKAISFERGNYMKWYFQKVEPFPYIPKEQLQWLEDDLKKTDKPSIVFCHEGVNGGFLNAINHEEIFDTLKKAPFGVRCCFCGHKHEDLLEEEDGIPVYFVNSMSGYSVPAQFAKKRFSEEIEEHYPNVRYMCVYEKPLYVIVTVDKSAITIEGRNSNFVQPSPQEAGVKFDEGNITFSAKTSSVKL